MGILADLLEPKKEQPPDPGPVDPATSGGFSGQMPRGEGLFNDLLTEQPIGFLEKFTENPLEKLPFSPIAAAKNISVIVAAKRLRDKDFKYEDLVSHEERFLASMSDVGTETLFFGDDPERKPRTQQSISLEAGRRRRQDIEFVEKFILERDRAARRGTTTGGKIGSIVSEMPAFMVEFMVTGGLATLGKKSVKKIGVKILKEYSETAAGKAAIGAGGFAVGTALQATAMPHRAVESITRRQTPADITIDDAGNVTITGPVEKPFTAIWKGLADHYIEIASEHAGEALAPGIGQIMGRLPFAGRMTKLLQPEWLRLNPGSNAGDFARKLASQAGYHGVISEVGEEFLGDATRALFDTNDFGAGPGASMAERIGVAAAHDVKNLPAMVPAFLVPGVVRAGASAAISRADPGVPRLSDIELTQPDQTIAEAQGRQVTPEQDAAQAGQLRRVMREQLRTDAAAAEQVADTEDARQERDFAELEAQLDSINTEIRAEMSEDVAQTQQQIDSEGRSQVDPTQSAQEQEIIEPVDEAAQETVRETTEVPPPQANVWRSDKGEIVIEDPTIESGVEAPTVQEKLPDGTTAVKSRATGDVLTLAPELTRGKNETPRQYSERVAALQPPAAEEVRVEQREDGVSPEAKARMDRAAAKIIGGIERQNVDDAVRATFNELAEAEVQTGFPPKVLHDRFWRDVFPTLSPEVQEQALQELGNAMGEKVTAENRQVFIEHMSSELGAVTFDSIESGDRRLVLMEAGLSEEVARVKKEPKATQIPTKKALPAQPPAAGKALPGPESVKSTVQSKQRLSKAPSKPPRTAPTQAKRGLPESAKSTVQKMIEAEAAEEVQVSEAKRQVSQTEEGLTGLSKQRRSLIKRQTADTILDHEIYQAALAGQEVTEREVDVGFYYVEPSGRHEIETVIGEIRPGRFKTALQKMFTFRKSDLIANGGRAISWDVAVQNGFEATEGTEGHLDLTEFAERVKGALDGKKSEPGSKRLNSRAMDTSADTGEPFIEMMVNKFRMLHHGATKGEINDMILEVADHYNIDRDAASDDMIDGDEIARLESLPDEQADAEIERLATQQIEAEDLSDAEAAAKEVLNANGVDVHIEQVEEITPDTLLENLPEKPDDDVPFEVRGKPTGAALMKSDRQVILLAYGADSETGYHEGYHVLRPRLTERDRTILARSFADEEAEAAAFGQYTQDRKSQTGAVKLAFEKLVRLLKKIRAALVGRGFRTHEDIFIDIAAGQARGAVSRSAGAVKFETSGERARREVNKNARIKARAARLKAGRKVGKVSRARLKIKLNDTTPFLRPDLKPLPPAKEVTVTGLPEARKGAKTRFSEEGMIQFRERRKKTLREIVTEKAKGYKRGFDRRLESMSARLNKIHPLLMSKVRRYVFDVDTRTVQLIEQTAPFIKGIKKIKGNDKRDLKYALQNNWRDKIDELVGKYGLQKEYQSLRDVLDAIHEAGNEVGLEIQYRGDHYPRRVKDLKGLLKFLDTSDRHSAFERAMQKRQEQAGGRELTDNEKTQVINTLLRGFRIGGVSLSRPGVVKDRSIEEFERNIEKYYYELDEALEMYIQDMVQSIGTREFFGKQTAVIAKLRAQESRLRTRLHKTQTRAGMTKPVTLERHKEHLSNAARKLEEIHETLEAHKNQKLEDSIGFFAQQLPMDVEQQDEVGSMLKAIMEPKGLHGATRDYVKLAYVDVLANIPVAMTQLEELGLSVYRDGIRALPAAERALLKKDKLKLSEIGIDDVNQYMKDLGLQGLMDKAIFAMRAVDKFGKQTLLNTELSRATRLAKNSPHNPKFVTEMERVFGGEARDVINDLAAERITDNVKFLMFSKILDLQPSAITEVPEYYASGGNWRVLYMLRQFTLKRMSVLRNKAVKTFAKGSSPAQRLEALYDLSKMLAILTAFGVGKDLIKAWYLGKDFDFWDSVLDNMLQYVFLSRWRVQSLNRQKPSSIILEEIGPAAKLIDNAARDFNSGKLERTVRSVPIIGEEYYWWFGGGSQKGERNEFLDIYDPFN